MSFNTEAFLKELGIEYTDRGGSDLWALCWQHEGDSDASLSIRREDCVGHCFGCGYTFNALSLAEEFLDFQNRFELLKFMALFSEENISEDMSYAQLCDDVFNRRNSEETSVVEITRPCVLRVPDNHTYVYGERGLRRDEIDKWGIGILEGDTEDYKWVDGWVYVPIYQKGVLVSYFLRSITNGKKLYKKGDRSKIIFGIDDTDPSRTIYLCEGIFDCIYLRRAGVDAVAILSNKILDAQYQILRNYEKIVLVPDNDSNLRGYELLYTARSLMHVADVEVAFLPRHVKDAAMCNDTELKFTVNNKQHLYDVLKSPKYLQFLNIKKSIKRRFTRVKTLVS